MIRKLGISFAFVLLEELPLDVAGADSGAGGEGSWVVTGFGIYRIAASKTGIRWVIRTCLL